MNYALWFALIDVLLLIKMYNMLRRVNTFANKVKVGTDSEGRYLYHPVHEYRDSVKNIYADDFLKSQAFKDFQERTGRATLSFSKFKEGAFKCPCIQAPKMKVCVDEIETEFNELTKTFESKLRRRPATEACCIACVEQDMEKERLGEGEFCYVNLYFTRKCSIILSSFYLSCM